MKYLDLFSGIGGFHLGLLQAGFKFDWCGYSEIDKYAKQIYQKHFPESEDLGDVRTIKLDRLPRIDLITFGFPCQDLSIAGKRGGLSASRSGLFFEAMQIIRVTRPNYFIFENVKGLFSSNGGRDWLTILREIANIGYDGQWQLLNTRWVLPQNRERIYFIGHLRGECRPKIFPIGGSDQLLEIKNEIKRISKNGEGIAHTLDATYYKGVAQQARTMIQINNTLNTSQGQRVYDINGVSCQLTSLGGGWGAKTGLYEVQSGIRRLTPIECERLQGFPDGWTEGLSDTQRYKCLGNAVTVLIVELIAKKFRSKIYV